MSPLPGQYSARLGLIKIGKRKTSERLLRSDVMIQNQEACRVLGHCFQCLPAIAEIDDKNATAFEVARGRRRTSVFNGKKMRARIAFPHCPGSAKPIQTFGM